MSVSELTDEVAALPDRLDDLEIGEVTQPLELMQAREARKDEAAIDVAPVEMIDLDLLADAAPGFDLDLGETSAAAGPSALAADFGVESSSMHPQTNEMPARVTRIFSSSPCHPITARRRLFWQLLQGGTP